MDTDGRLRIRHQQVVRSFLPALTFGGALLQLRYARATAHPDHSIQIYRDEATLAQIVSRIVDAQSKWFCPILNLQLGETGDSASDCRKP